MNKLTISIFGKEILFEVLKKLKLFSKYDIKYYKDLNLLKKIKNNLAIVFVNNLKEKDSLEITKSIFPLIIVTKSQFKKNNLLGSFVEIINTPLNVLDLEKKIVSLLSKYEFNKRSLINLNGYIIDKNEKKIKKNNLYLELTEKEINFLTLFSKSSKPVTRNFILEKVWNYSKETDTHTVETHIHRLRKKIQDKFGDNNFIKNSDKGYYI
tara:strand:+ start:298 stop:927 length:630 start_codon:yes stop_codon:yes gene_type:complete